MIMQKTNPFALFGSLDTWVVGVQYYAGKAAAENQEVIFERDPDNPFDPNAIAVQDAAGVPLGHLPRYDAEYMSPLIEAGVIALHGATGESTRNDRVPLRLMVYATKKVEGVLSFDEADDWRSIFHNQLAGLWNQLDRYGAVTLGAFRDRFRPIAHEETLYPKTQLLYRLLKARIEQERVAEQLLWRDRLLCFIELMQFGHLCGWPEMSVIPLFDGEEAAGDAIEDAAPSVAADTQGHALVAEKTSLSVLPKHCPFPKGARGALILVHGAFYALEWFPTEGEHEVAWYPMLAEPMEEASLTGHRPNGDGVTGGGAMEMKERLIGLLRGMTVTEVRTEDGRVRLDMEIGLWRGGAEWFADDLCRIRLRVVEEAAGES